MSIVYKYKRVKDSVLQLSIVTILCNPTASSTRLQQLPPYQISYYYCISKMQSLLVLALSLLPAAFAAPASDSAMAKRTPGNVCCGRSSPQFYLLKKLTTTPQGLSLQRRKLGR